MKKTKEAPEWKSTDLAREELIDPMLEDMGISVADGADARVIKATRKYVMGVIGLLPEQEPFVLAMGGPRPVTMGEIEDIANHFCHGYEQCVLDLGLLKQ